MVVKNGDCKSLTPAEGERTGKSEMNGTPQNKLNPYVLDALLRRERETERESERRRKKF